MAIELDTYSEPSVKGGGWIVNGIETDAVTAVEIKAAPGTGNALYIKKIILQSLVQGIKPQLQDDNLTPNIIFGPIYMTPNSAPFVMDFGEHPIKLAENAALDIKTAEAGEVFVFVKGFSHPV